MKFIFLKNIVCVLFLMFASLAFANAPEKPPKKWPCDQVYNPKLDLKAVWSGPQIDDFKKNWWKDDEGWLDIDKP